MSDTMKVQSFATLLRWILKEYEENESIFGIHRSLFFRPVPGAPYARENVLGHALATPYGPAAGPHTQLAQNIVAAWLSGGRFIELKTVQIMDELEIPRPCIDMADEGYNVEWSQELKLEQSADEYVHAWALIHVLRRLLGHEGKVPLGTIFNMSVGYDLKGIQSPPMARFVDRLADASEAIAGIRATLRREFPRFADVEIPARVSNNVTLSTMHGCPPDEIERIARHLLEERGLHTSVKMNPTLIGKEEVDAILHRDLGFREIVVPDSVFAHDLRYDRAVDLIRTLRSVAAARGLVFGVKLSNTLASVNHRGVLPGAEAYMSGRALYPLTIGLFAKLAREFRGELEISFSGGADALNAATLLAAGARTVTAVSDLLKPGGYSVFLQYIENLEEEMRRSGAADLDAFAANRLAVVERAAAEARRNPRYGKAYRAHGLPKVESGLALFDCIDAPCVEKCAVSQDVPEYAWSIARGDHDRALEIVLSRNPLPGVTGHVCTHLCQERCTRNNSDEPVQIRALKRFAVERGKAALRGVPMTDRRVAIVGSGPSGLAAAAFLALNGVRPVVFEAKDVPGGMLAVAPSFRLPPDVVREDIARIEKLGVRIELSHPVASPPEELLREGFEAVYVACGFPKDARLKIEGIDGEGVFAGLDLLERASRGDAVPLGPRVLVIGGGNTAMDAARTARRLTGKPVTVVYRRSRAEMPATNEEIEGLLAEGNVLETLAAPSRVILRDGRVAALECARTRLGEPGPDGRRRFEPAQGSEFRIEADSIVVAIGQAADVAFLDGSSLATRENGAIAIDAGTGFAGAGAVYAGGDATRGPSIIVEACADGRRAAEAILTKLGVPARVPANVRDRLTEEEITGMKRARARKEPPRHAAMLPPERRGGFDLVEQPLTEEEARREASRCLQCSSFCDKCVDVCPNRANYSYRVAPSEMALPVLSCKDGRLVRVGEEPFRIRDGRQIVHLDDFCNECGNCATFCVHQGKPYLEKPRLFLEESDFLKESDNAFFIRGSEIRRREKGKESRLAVRNGTVEFENDALRLRLSDRFDIKEMTLKTPFDGGFSLREAAEMKTLLDGVSKSAAFLLP